MGSTTRPDPIRGCSSTATSREQARHHGAMHGPRILVVGSTMTDLVAYAPRLPEAGETVVGTDFQTGFGGKGANQAVAAARFGAAVAMVTAVGDDAYGRSTLANLAAEGIDVTDVEVAPGSSGIAPIWVDGSGMNRIIIVPGANLAVRADAATAGVARWGPTVVVGQFEIPRSATTAGFMAARAAGAVTILNPAPGAPIAAELLALTDWLVPNESEFASIAGHALSGDDAADDAAIAEFGDRIGTSLVVTLGERGAVVRSLAGTPTRVDSPRVDAVDTTGAGDAFVGAFAVGLGLGWDAVDAARLGCAAAADSVTRVGTQRSFADPQRAAVIVDSVRPG
jgi:ribokinase